MIWRMMVVFGIMLGAITGTVQATRAPDFSLPPPLLVLRDNRLYRVTVVGNFNAIFDTNEGEISQFFVLAEQRAVLVNVRTESENTVYRIDDKTLSNFTRIFLFSSNYNTGISVSPDNNKLLYVWETEGGYTLFVQNTLGEQLAEYFLGKQGYLVSWKNNDEIILRHPDHSKQFVIDLTSNTVSTSIIPEIFNYFGSLHPNLSPNGEWEMVREAPVSRLDSVTREYPTYLVNNISQSEILISTSGSFITWSKDSQWAVVMPEIAHFHRNIYIFHAPSETLELLLDGAIYRLNGNRYVTQGVSVNPETANWSYDNEWILYSVITERTQNPTSRTYFNVVHRDGKVHFRDIIGIKSNPLTPFWAQWLPPDEPQHLHEGWLLIGVAGILGSGYGLRRMGL